VRNLTPHLNLLTIFGRLEGWKHSPPTLAVECDHNVVSVTFFLFFCIFFLTLCIGTKGHIALCLAMEKKNLICPFNIVRGFCSGGAQYVTLQNIFFTSKFSYLLFCNPTHKTETGTHICEELLIANHLDQSSYMMGQSEALSICHNILITLFSAGAHLCCAFYQPP
jgi:hypothetical protein